MNLIKNLPLAITGLILAILSLGKIYTDYLNIFLIIGSFLTLLVLIKFIFEYELFSKELDNLIPLSTFGTFSMALMLLSTYIQPIYPAFTKYIALGIWIIGILLHIFIIVQFTRKYVLRNFDINNVYASWWIVYIGITMAAITAPAFNLAQYGFIFFGFGFIMMIPTLILVSYRYIKYNEIDDKNKPFICIYAAILSIILVGYVNSSPINGTFLSAIYIIAFIFYIFALFNAIKFLAIERIKFMPSFSAFTFPFVISAIATGAVYEFFKIDILNYLFNIQGIIALILVIFVGYNYLKFILNQEKQGNK